MTKLYNQFGARLLIGQGDPGRQLEGYDLSSALAAVLDTNADILFVTTAGTSERGLTAQVVSELLHDNIVVYDKVETNANLDAIDDFADHVALGKNAWVVAVGGGSAIDTAKALAVAVGSRKPHAMHQHLRQGQSLNWSRALPIFAIPTIAGSGSEATPFASVWDFEAGTKHSIDSDCLRPSAVFLDPGLLKTVPQESALYARLDCISHCLESLWNRNRTEISKAFTDQALGYLAVVVGAEDQKESPLDIDRQSYNMQQASLLAGNAIGCTRTAIAHSISYPLTACYGVPHGLASSFALLAILDKVGVRVFDSAQSKSITSVLKYLKSIDFQQKMRPYVSAAQIEGLVDQMYLPQRADNFVERVSPRLIRDLVQAATNGW